ncbi:hypothetical protein RG47T_3319 [Mucilaginibacter polytrichastri]|uniref:Uncharacterized protein n=2 Tax=Mucilaginibacter polytrichastri TaxID=1302689 RepID=A0A1Q6A1G2_9SPHI|nr:hypothetical protein RG47T_3319 [Mucilaginibacter polytrichastri]
MLQFLTICWLSLFHPFYVSVTEINHNAKNQSIEISCRMFYDDLERELNKTNHSQIDIVKPKDKTEVNRMITDYVKKHLTIKADGKILTLSFVGYEIQEDGAWSYFEVKGISKVKQLTVHDDLLYPAHPEQINMIHATVNGERKSTKLDNPEADASFSF